MRELFDRLTLRPDMASNRERISNSPNCSHNACKILRCRPQIGDEKPTSHEKESCQHENPLTDPPHKLCIPIYWGPPSPEWITKGIKGQPSRTWEKTRSFTIINRDWEANSGDAKENQTPPLAWEAHFLKNGHYELKHGHKLSQYEACKEFLNG